MSITDELAAAEQIITLPDENFSYSPFTSGLAGNVELVDKNGIHGSDTFMNLAHFSSEDYRLELETLFLKPKRNFDNGLLDQQKWDRKPDLRQVPSMKISANRSGLTIIFLFCRY
jgi:hypothetical protein